MSPRLKLLRKVVNPPPIKGFKPYGPAVDAQKTEVVNLYFEEYEALRLCDYDMFNHAKASQLMGVSRPTFTRVYASARQKIAKAMVEGKQIAIEGGKVYFDSDWYHCKDCNCNFNNPAKDKEITHCPLCGSLKIDSCDLEKAPDNDKHQKEDMCECPDCGYKKQHELGMPCSTETCPECQTPMRRKRRNKC